MEVICLEDDAFYTLMERVMERLSAKQNIKEDKWISGDEAMQKLRITSKTTLQKFRNEGRIPFTQPDKKIILYDTLPTSPLPTRLSNDCLMLIDVVYH